MLSTYNGSHGINFTRSQSSSPMQSVSDPQLTVEEEAKRQHVQVLRYRRTFLNNNNNEFFLSMTKPPRNISTKLYVLISFLDFVMY